MKVELWGGWSRAQWVRFSVSVLLFFGLAPPASWLMGWGAASGVAWATGVVVLLYTIETHYMRLEMVRSNAMQVQPVLVTRLGHPPPGEGEGERLWVHNIGKGPALHVTFEEIGINFTDIQFSVKSAVKFFSVDFVEAGQQEVVRPIFGDDVGGVFRERFEWLVQLDSRHASQHFPVIIHYEDIEGRSYTSELQMGKGGTRLLRVRRR
jgi:hypothetical protein